MLFLYTREQKQLALREKIGKMPIVPGRILEAEASDSSQGNMSIYQPHKAMKKPHPENKNARPYLSIGLSTGIDLAL